MVNQWIDVKHIETKKNWTINTSNRRFFARHLRWLSDFWPSKGRKNTSLLVGSHLMICLLGIWLRPQLTYSCIKLSKQCNIYEFPFTYDQCIPMLCSFDMVLVHCHLWFPVSRAPTTGLLISCVRQRNCPRCAALLVKWSLLPFGQSFVGESQTGFAGESQTGSCWILSLSIFRYKFHPNRPILHFLVEEIVDSTPNLSRGQLSNLMKIIKGNLERVITHHWALI